MSRLRAARARARAPLLLLLALGACRPGAVAPRDDVLGVAELTVDFPDDGQGDLWFAIDCPLDVGAQVTSLSWELWLASRRFATGLEGTPDTAPVGHRLVRVAVHAPLRYRHVRWEPGPAFVEVGLNGELTVSKRGVEATVPFRGRRELLTRGVPRLDDGRESQ